MEEEEEPQDVQEEEEEVQVQCCLTSTETIRTIRDGDPRTATSTFTQLLSSEQGDDELSINSCV